MTREPPPVTVSRVSEPLTPVFPTEKFPFTLKVRPVPTVMTLAEAEFVCATKPETTALALDRFNVPVVVTSVPLPNTSDPAVPVGELANTRVPWSKMVEP